MMPSGANGHLTLGGDALLLVLTLVPGASTAGTVGPALEPGSLPILFGLLGLAGLALLVALFFFGDASERQRRRAVRGRLAKLDLPAAISGIDGTLDWSNQAMRTASGDSHGDIIQTLGRVVEIDAGQIYRLAASARATGFAFVPVRSLQQDCTVVLSVQVGDPKRLVWMVIPMERFPSIDAKTQLHSIAPVSAPDCDMSNSVRKNLSTDSAVATVTASATLNAVPVALMQFDFDGRVLWHNAAAREMLGQKVQSGTSLSELVEPLGRSVDALIADCIANERGRREMVRLRGGELDIFLQISLTRVNFGAGPSLLAVLSDASELRLLEDKFVQSQKMEAVGKLAGGVAHDFNNVLTAISGHSDLLLLGKDALHQDYSDLVQIRQNTHRAAALVRQLLAFSRKQTLNPTLMSVQDVVSDTQYLLNRLIGEKVVLNLEHGRDLGAVRADHQQFEQAIMNLVVNARDAMPNGGMITISTRNLVLADQNATQGIEIPSGEYVEISVSDNGAGIEPHLIDRIFDPFFTTKGVGEGTGLGLSTVYGIVKQSGGFIFADNLAEGGARFRIILPRAYPSADDRIPARNPARAARGDQTGTGAILLVEDEDPVRSFVSRALRLRGYDVAEAASAEEAMEHLSDSANHVDLLVSDVVMPGMDGPTFAVQARMMRPGLRVVFISGYAEDSFRRNLVDPDFLFLAKPFSLIDLTAKVKEALEQGA